MLELEYAKTIYIQVFFAMIIRALNILKVLAIQMDEKFKVVNEAYPYLVHWTIIANLLVYIRH